MNNYILINQKFVEENSATISVKERACRYGDGIFETLKIIDSIVYDYEAHEARIIRGLKALQISHNVSLLKKNCYKLIAKNEIKNGILRIAISRGIGSMGYLPKDEIKALEIIETMPPHKVAAKKISIGISKIKLPSLSQELQKCKTMRSLNYILAKINARKSGNFDDVMLSNEGFIGEGSSANIFWIKNNKIYTPSLKCNILSGTIRQKIISKFPRKINVVEEKISAIKNADGVFLTNSNILVLPVDELVLKGERVRFKKNIVNEIIEFIEMDIKNIKFCNFKLTVCYPELTVCHPELDSGSS